MFHSFKRHVLSIAVGVGLLTGFGAFAPAQAQSDPFIGQISWFAGNFAPRGWALCDGQLLSIAQNTALFSILGTTYGGDGRTTFGLPDMRGRNPVHAGTGPGLPQVRLGQKGGSPTTTLSIANMPQHSHSATSTATSTATSNATGTAVSTATSASTLNAVSGGGTIPSPVGNLLANDGTDRIYSSAAADTTMAAGAVTTATTVDTSVTVDVNTDVTTTVSTGIGNTGGSQAFNVQDPYTSINCIIALVGIFPSRN